MKKLDKPKESEVKYPKGENVCVTCCERGGKPMFLITNKPLIDTYFIYEFTGDGLVKLGKGQSPSELEKKFDVKRRIGA